MRRFLTGFKALCLAAAVTLAGAQVAQAAFSYHVWPKWLVDLTTYNAAYEGTLLSFGHSTSAPAHLATAQTTAPALTSCGTSPTISGTDTAGTVTMGTGTPTGCVITFNVAYTTAPHCVVTWIATPLASQSYVTSATAITLTQTATSSNVVKYMCMAPSGG
jgi:hypothetical protein